MNYHLVIPVKIVFYLSLGIVLYSCTEEKQKPVKNPFDSTIVWDRSGQLLSEKHHPNLICGTSALAQDMFKELKWMDSFHFLICRNYSITQKNFYRFMDELQKAGSYRIRNYQHPQPADVSGEKDPEGLYRSDSLFVSRFPGKNYVLKLNDQDSVPLNITFSMNDKTIRMNVCTNQKVSKKISGLLISKHLAKRVPE